MPPCPPQVMEVVPDKATTPALDIADKTPKPQSTGMLSSMFPNQTYATQVNAISFVVMAAIFVALPADYRVFFYGFLAVIAFDAYQYYSTRGTMAGVPYTLPMVSLIYMLVNPVPFWAQQGTIAMESGEGISANTLVGKFMVFVTDPKKCREIFTGEGTYQLYAHPNAKWLFGANNLIYMTTESHKKFRALLTPALFSNEALTTYAKFHEGVCEKFLAKYAEENKGKPFDVRIAFRSMAAAASQESFMGPYLDDDLRRDLEADILTFTNGFLCFPFPYLGTGLAQAVAAKKRIQAVIRGLMPKAREHVAQGNEPRCLLEYWTAAIAEAAKQEGVKPEELSGCSDTDVAITVMDFLFAAQDATNSALTFTADVLTTRPDVVDRVRAEVAANKDKPIWTQIRDTNELEYTKKAANQLIHHKPPVPMVPHLALKDAILGGRRIPKGTILIPSVAYSARVSGASDEYIPERENPDTMFVKNSIFGGGQHKCPGRRYAECLLTVFFAVFNSGYTCERVGPRPGRDDIMYFPTLFPASNMFILSPRAE